MSSIFFWNPYDTQYGWLSPYSANRIVVHGKVYKSMEHYFQSRKYLQVNTSLVRLIEQATTGQRARQIAQLQIHHLEEEKELYELIRPFIIQKIAIRKDWPLVEEDEMWRACKAKFSPESLCAQLLKATGDKTLIFHSFEDPYWGVGVHKTGQNKLGCMLMKLRHRLNQPHENVSLTMKFYFQPGSCTSPSTFTPNHKKTIKDYFTTPKERVYIVIDDDDDDDDDDNNKKTNHSSSFSVIGSII